MSLVILILGLQVGPAPIDTLVIGGGVYTPQGEAFDLEWIPNPVTITETWGSGEGEVYYSVGDHEIRASLDPITEDTWSSAVILTPLITYNHFQTRARAIVPVTRWYVPNYFAIKYRVVSYSPLSNVVSRTAVPYPDPVPPEAVTMVSTASSSGSVSLTWTAPWDNYRTAERCETYEVRTATMPILTPGDWQNALPVAGAPAPAVAGTPQSMTIDGLTESVTHHFCIIAADATPNWGGLSNSVAVLVAPDPLPPAQPSDFAILSTTEESVTLEWTSSGDDDMTGTASKYDLRLSLAGPITTDAEFLSGIPVQGLPRPLQAGTPQGVVARGLEPRQTYHFALRIADERLKWSGRAQASGMTGDYAGSSGNSTPCGGSGTFRDSRAGIAGPALILLLSSTLQLRR